MSPLRPEIGLANDVLDVGRVTRDHHERAEVDETALHVEPGVSLQHPPSAAPRGLVRLVQLVDAHDRSLEDRRWLEGPSPTGIRLAPSKEVAGAAVRREEDRLGLHLSEEGADDVAERRLERAGAFREGEEPGPA